MYIQLHKYRTEDNTSAHALESPETPTQPSSSGTRNLYQHLFRDTGISHIVTRPSNPSVEEEFNAYCHATGWPPLETIDIVTWWDVSFIHFVLLV